MVPQYEIAGSPIPQVNVTLDIPGIFYTYNNMCVCKLCNKSVNRIALQTVSLCTQNGQLVFVLREFGLFYQPRIIWDLTIYKNSASSVTNFSVFSIHFNLLNLQVLIT